MNKPIVDYKQELNEIEKSLAEMELRYNMSSDEFYAGWIAGYYTGKYGNEDYLQWSIMIFERDECKLMEELREAKDIIRALSDCMDQDDSQSIRSYIPHDKFYLRGIIEQYDRIRLASMSWLTAHSE